MHLSSHRERLVVEERRDLQLDSNPRSGDKVSNEQSPARRSENAQTPDEEQGVFLDLANMQKNQGVNTLSLSLFYRV